jgi:hypothetical protein
MSVKKKKCVEFTLVRLELDKGLEKRRTKCRNILQVDLIWPRSGIAKKSAARETVFSKGVCDFTKEEWTKRILFREDVEEHCGIAIGVTEPVSIQKVRRFFDLTAKYALKMGADFVEKAMLGYADIASAPIEALAAMVGEKDVPKIIARGVFDFSIPPDSDVLFFEVPLISPSMNKQIGKIVLKAKV